jgi:hypothetical protein
MQLEPHERPLRDAGCPYQTGTPARYSRGAAAGDPGGRTGKRCRRRHLLAPSSGRSHFFVLQDQGEVCTLSGGVIHDPYPPHYRAAFACSLVPYPPRRRSASRLPYPAGAGTGLPRSADVPGEEEVASRRRGGVICVRPVRKAATCPLALLAQACQPLWPVLTNGAWRRFTCVDRPSRSWFPTALRLAVAAPAHAGTALTEEGATLSRGLRTPPLPATHAPVGYCGQNRR